MSPEATNAFLSGLGEARQLQSLHLMQCHLGSTANLHALSSGLKRCRSCLTKLEIHDVTTNQSFLNELLRCLQPALSGHPSIETIRIYCEMGILNEAGCKALGALLFNSHDSVLKRVEITLQGISENISLESLCMKRLIFKTLDGSVLRLPSKNRSPSSLSSSSSSSSSPGRTTVDDSDQLNAVARLERGRGRKRQKKSSAELI
eukprot:CAMPEP_0116577092 /NCGR_PEP_ID=MMETSP0397-20121206/20926_1 /TAXON_ID=216820 /ORGANISM="Cyclophora tenuis, Strain ECT3854" /LENGTH=203 /DNA_ID=CAMNT_0004106267 /DNA_START=417 /DNA_END=1028 /DNA_ORIENTATION=-